MEHEHYKELMNCNEETNANLKDDWVAVFDEKFQFIERMLFCATHENWKTSEFEQPDPNIELNWRWKDHLKLKMKAWNNLKKRCSVEEAIKYSFDETVKFKNRHLVDNIQKHFAKVHTWPKKNIINPVLITDQVRILDVVISK